LTRLVENRSILHERGNEIWVYAWLEREKEKTREREKERKRERAREEKQRQTWQEGT
jgi:hypothetical protein